jgi:uncharacterized protein YndB with AHSA1/START domain
VADASPIVKEVFLDATPEEVFAYLTESTRYIQWMGVAAELDPRPGGIFRLDPNGSGSDAISGTFVEVTPPTRIVFTWGYESAGHRVPPGSTTVEIDLIPRAGGTLLRLVHRGLDGADQTGHTAGWAHYLERLGARAAGRDPGPDALADPRFRHSADVRPQRWTA